MKLKKIINCIIPYLGVIFAAFLFSYSIRAFVNKGGLLTSGLSGISLVVARCAAMIKFKVPLDQLMNSSEIIDFVNTITSVVFFAGNVPLIYLAFRKLGKRFALLTTIFIIFNTLFIRLLPESIMDFFLIQNDSGLAHAVFAGVFCGLAVSITLKVGASPGGSEIVTTYLSRKKQVSIGKLSIIINACVIIIGGIVLREWTLILFTLVLVFVSGSVVDALHRVTFKKAVYIVTDQHILISKTISSATKYNCTYWKAHGGFSGQHRYVVMVVVPENITGQIIELVENIDQAAFTVVVEVNSVHGNFYMEPLK